MKFKTLTLIATALFAFISLSHCGGGSGDSDSSSDGGSGSGSGSGSGALTINYDHTGTIFLVQMEAIAAGSDTEGSAASISFTDDSGEVNTTTGVVTGQTGSATLDSLLPNGYLGGTTGGASLVTSTCVADDSFDEATDTESDTTAAETLSAGTATITSGGSAVSTIVPTLTSTDVVYNTLPITTGGLLDFGDNYNVDLAGATNTDPAITVTGFDVDLVLSNMGTVTLGGTSLATTATSGGSLSLGDLDTLAWTAMSGVNSFATSATDFGYQTVSLSGADTAGTTVGSVTCILYPGEGNLTTALANSASGVLDVLNGSDNVSILIDQFHVVMSFPGDTGFVVSIGAALKSFLEIDVQ